VSIVGSAEARPADGLAVDFVVESDRAQLSEIVQRVRDGRLRTNIGNVSTLDDAIARPSGSRPSGSRGRHRPRSSVSDTRPSMRAASRSYPDRPAASYQPRRGQPGKLPMAPGIRCRTGFLTLEHIQQRDK
jgi:hypothetical protein